MKDTSAQKTINRLQEPFCRFGFSENLVSDNGPQFTSDAFADYMRSIGPRHVCTAPYHPSSNGPAARFVQSLKAALRKNPSVPLHLAIAEFLLAYRNTAHTTTGELTSLLLLGRRLCTRIDLVKPSIQVKVPATQFNQTLKRYHCRHQERLFKVGGNVKVRNFRRGVKWFSATILAQTVQCHTA